VGAAEDEGPAVRVGAEELEAVHPPLPPQEGSPREGEPEGDRSDRDRRLLATRGAPPAVAAERPRLLAAGPPDRPVDGEVGPEPPEGHTFHDTEEGGVTHRQISNPARPRRAGFEISLGRRAENTVDDKGVRS
jgi:hypothetical protein